MFRYIVQIRKYTTKKIYKNEYLYQIYVEENTFHYRQIDLSQAKNEKESKK